MGSVYRAEQVQLGRPVAIKFLHDWVVRDPQLLKRFEIEVRAMSRMAHPNCVSVLDCGVAREPYLVMDLVQGQTLREVLRCQPESLLPAGRSLRIIHQVLAGLAHAHGHRIVHRDIKPENIVLDQTPGFEDHVRLLDFGLARLRDQQSNLTQGMAVGTPNYMAPEQIGGAVDERTDVYAAGVVLFEMLTGRAPFDHEQIAVVLHRQLHVPPPPLRSVRPQAGFSPTLEATLLRSLAKAQAVRFPSAAAFAAALEATPEARGGSRADLDATVYVGAAAPTSTPVSVPATVTAAQTVVSPASTMIIRVRLQPVLAAAQRLAARGLALGAPALATLKRRSRAVRMGAAAVLAASLVIALIVRSGASDFRPPPAAAPGVVVGHRAEEIASRSPREVAKELVRRGESERALRLLADLQRDDPADPEIAALQAQLLFERRWWSEGAAAYRTALQGDPSQAENPVLLGHLIEGLQSSRFHPRASAMLREIGEPAKPLLENAARDNPSSSVRARAAALLRRW